MNCSLLGDSHWPASASESTHTERQAGWEQDEQFCLACKLASGRSGLPVGNDVSVEPLLVRDTGHKNDVPVHVCKRISFQSSLEKSTLIVSYRHQTVHQTTPSMCSVRC